MRLRHGLVGLAVTALCASLVVTAGPAFAAACAAPASGGEWPLYGRDISGTRYQPEENVIGPGEVFDLEGAWTVNGSTADETGNVQSTPVVSDGCVFATTSAGRVLALNAETGEEVWATTVGGGLYTAAVANGLVYLNVSRNIDDGGPYAVALNQGDGTVAWESAPFSADRLEGASLSSSAVVSADIMFVGISAPEGNPAARGAFVLVDAGTGAILKKTFVIPDEDFALGFSGGGVWSTAVIDPETKYAYVGSGNPFNKGVDHRYTNAILKVDVDRTRPSFGEIVDAFKGDIDQYYPFLNLLAEGPACTAGVLPTTIDHPECGQLDLDFGSSPNLWVDFSGKKVVGVLQKSGVFHAAYADNMERAWSSIVGLPCALCNAATSAYDPETHSVYVAGAPGSVMVALDGDSGVHRWASPIADGTHYQAVSAANGVVYTVDTKGFLDTFDAATGLPAAVRPMSFDTGAACVALGGGVAIARNHVYATCGEWLIGYAFDEGF